MIPVFLTSIKTHDGISLDGIAVLPRHKRTVALIWIHGLGSNFARGQSMIAELTHQCSRHHIGYFKFNTRGHDIVARGKKDLAGYGFEKFETCIFDIHAMILYARKCGFKHIILAGHSTGANKALYYLYKKQNPFVKGLILVAGVSDVAAERNIKGVKRVQQGIRVAKLLNRKNPYALMPQTYGVITAQRYLSLYQAGTKEDVFPYYNPRASWKELGNIKTPISVIMGSRDEYLDISVKKYMDLFRGHARSTKAFYEVIIKGATHGFYRKEKEISYEIIKSIKRAVV